MKIERLTIRNYRAIEHISVECTPNINIIYGENGVGKSSILYMLHDFLVWQEACTRRGEGAGGGPMSGTVSGSMSGPAASTAARRTLFAPAKIRDARLPSELIFNEGLPGSTRVCWHPEDGRVTCEGQLDLRRVSFIPTLLHARCLQDWTSDAESADILDCMQSLALRGIADFRTVRACFMDLLREEEIHRARGQGEYRHPALQKVREVLCRINPALSSLALKREDGREVLAVEREGRLLSIEEQLSSGEAGFLGMVVEICLAAFAEDTSGRDILVLIDELETSLHPGWQMKMAPLLKESFPDIQFIITSHSPFIWAGLDKREVLWLVRDGEGRVVRREVPFARGGSVEAIIARFFTEELYDEAFVRELHAVEEAIGQKDRERALSLMEAMHTRYGEIPALSLLQFRMRMLGL